MVSDEPSGRNRSALCSSLELQFLPEVSNNLRHICRDRHSDCSVCFVSDNPSRNSVDFAAAELLRSLGNTDRHADWSQTQQPQCLRPILPDFGCNLGDEVALSLNLLK